ncbi:hypothetical protein FS837_000202 [Tulasnella sp. UAMH 9824]|nr:hypothetical protein FS837_000202 [Tulasnella sp. UAMH 9824]
MTSADATLPGLEGLTEEEFARLKESNKLVASSLPEPCKSWLLGERLFVEFLGVGDNGPDVDERKNHVVMRVLFATYHGTWKGVRISMDMLPDEDLEDFSSGLEIHDVYSIGQLNETWFPGEYYVKLIEFDEASRRCRQQFSFTFKQTTTLGDFIGLGYERKFAQSFVFVIKGLAWKGCRDFITQFYYWLVEDGFIDPLEADCAVPLYNLIGYVYRYGGTKVAMPVDKGGWRKGYSRVEKEGMGYPQTE